MLGLRYYACDGCDTVYAAPEEPPGCHDCDGDRLRDITGRLASDTYFFQRAE